MADDLLIDVVLCHKVGCGHVGGHGVGEGDRLVVVGRYMLIAGEDRGVESAQLLDNLGIDAHHVGNFLVGRLTQKLVLELGDSLAELCHLLLVRVGQVYSVRSLVEILHNLLLHPGDGIGDEAKALALVEAVSSFAESGESG